MLFIFIYTLTNTWAYFQQADLTQHQLLDKSARTAFFGKMDFSVNTITVLIQLCLTSRLLKWLGVGLTLTLMPMLSLVWLSRDWFRPYPDRPRNFPGDAARCRFLATAPGARILSRSLRREDKYKAKSFIDTFGYRAGDQVGAWSYKGLHELGLNISHTSFLAVPLVAGWCVLSLWLGKKQQTMARAREHEPQLQAA